MIQSPTLERQALLMSFLGTCTHSDLLFISHTLPSLLNPTSRSSSPSSLSSSSSSAPLSVFLNPTQEKKRHHDSFSPLPPELTLYILELTCNDDPWALVRAESVCKRWRALVTGEQALWKKVCHIWGFGSPSTGVGDKPSNNYLGFGCPGSVDPTPSYVPASTPQNFVHARQEEPLEEMEPYADLPMDPALEWIEERKRRARAISSSINETTITTAAAVDTEVVSETSPSNGYNESEGGSSALATTTNTSYRTHFRECCVKLIRWETGGRLLRSHKLPMPFSSFHPQPQHHHTIKPNNRSYLNSDTSREDDPTYIPSFIPNSNHYRQQQQQQQQQQQLESGNEDSVVTSLALDPDWIVVGLASSRIHVFSTRTGVLARTLVGHESGVWCVCLVSAGGVAEPSAKGSGKEAVNDESEEDVTKKAPTGVSKGKRRMAGKMATGYPVPMYASTSSSSSMSSSSLSAPSLASSLSPSPPPSRNEDKLNVPGASRTSSRNESRSRLGRHGGSGVSTDEDEGGLYSSLSLALRYAVGLGGEQNTKGKGKGKQRARGIQTVLDEDATNDDQSRHRHQRRQKHQSQGGDDENEDGNTRCRRYVPQRQSDPCLASEGWGQPHSLVVSGGCDKMVRVWDVRSGHCIYALPGHTSTIRCMRTLHGRPVAVTGARDGTVRTWDIQRGRPLKVLRGHTGSVRCLDVNGSRAASGSYDTTCRIWDLDTGECLFVLTGHYHQVYAVSFDGELVATGGLDTSVRVWDANTGQCLALLQGHTTLVCELRLSRKHQILVTGGSDGRVITFSLVTFDPDDEDYEPYMALPPLTSGREGGGGSDGRINHEKVALSLRQDVKGEFFSRKKRLRIPKSFFPKSNVGAGLSATTNYPLLRTTTEVSPISSSSLQQYQQYRDDHPQARVAFEPLHRVVAHTSSISALQFDGRYLVTGSLDGSVHLWETQTGRFVRKLTEDGEKIWKVGFTSASSAWVRRSRRAEGDHGIGSEEGEESDEDEDERIGEVCVIVGQRGVKTVLEVWKFGA